MARPLRAALALAAATLLAEPAGAIVVVREPPAAEANATNATVSEKRFAVSEGASATDNATDNESGLPFMGSTVQLALTTALEPVAGACREINRWTVTRLQDLQVAVNETKATPEQAVAVFFGRLGVLFNLIQEKLATATRHLHVAGPALVKLKKLMSAMGYAWSQMGIEHVMDTMFVIVERYRLILQNSTEVANSLKKVGKDGWHAAGEQLHELKITLDQGAGALRDFGASLGARVSQATDFLARSIGDDPAKLAPFKEAVNASWADLQDSADRLPVGLASSARMLPPELAFAVLPSGATAARGTLGLCAVALAVLAAIAP